MGQSFMRESPGGVPVVPRTPGICHSARFPGPFRFPGEVSIPAIDPWGWADRAAVAGRPRYDWPYTGIAAPDTTPDSLEMRNSTTAAISSGVGHFT